MNVDPYVDPVTRVLRNSLGISRPGELAAAERELTMAARYRIERQPIPGGAAPVTPLVAPQPGGRGAGRGAV
jgi:fido (protein-threonine AMPylation protein)